MYAYVYAYLQSLALSMRRPGDGDTPIAVNTLTGLNVVSKHHSQLKETRVDWRNS